MKMQLLTSLFGLFFLVSAAQTTLSAATLPAPSAADVQIVVTQKKIWFVTDESPMKKLDVQVMNEKGKIVLEKQFSSKMTDWSLDVRDLPPGTYQILLDTKLSQTFVRNAPRA